MESEPRRVRIVRENLPLCEGACLRVHLEQVNTLSVAFAAFRPLWRTIGACIGKNCGTGLRREGVEERNGSGAFEERAARKLVPMLTSLRVLDYSSIKLLQSFADCYTIY